MNGGLIRVTVAWHVAAIGNKDCVIGTCRTYGHCGRDTPSFHSTAPHTHCHTHATHASRNRYVNQPRTLFFYFTPSFSFPHVVLRTACRTHRITVTVMTLHFFRHTSVYSPPPLHVSLTTGTPYFWTTYCIYIYTCWKDPI